MVSRFAAGPWHSPATVPSLVLATQPTSPSLVACSTVCLRNQTPGQTRDVRARGAQERTREVQGGSRRMRDTGSLDVPCTLPNSSKLKRARLPELLVVDIFEVRGP